MGTKNNPGKSDVAVLVTDLRRWQRVLQDPPGVEEETRDNVIARLFGMAADALKALSGSTAAVEETRVEKKIDNPDGEQNGEH